MLKLQELNNKEIKINGTIYTIKVIEDDEVCVGITEYFEKIIKVVKSKEKKQI